MTEKSKNDVDILQPGELELYVQSMEPTKIENVGSSGWVEWHIRLQKLNQQAVIEANSMKEEYTKEVLISHGKLPVLVQEAICIQVWRTKILPEIMRMNITLKNTFSIYMVLYHETACVGLLETVLFHEDGAKALSDVLIDLIDYTAECTTVLLGQLNSDYYKECKRLPLENESTNEELERQGKSLLFDIGMRCISIIRYLAEHIEVGGAALAGRLYKTNDIPSLFAHLLDLEPWKRFTDSGELEYFDLGTWSKATVEAQEKMHNTEAQLWLCLRQLLLDPRLNSYYTFDNIRKSTFCRLQTSITDAILDQIPPLGELKMFLCRLAVSDVTQMGQGDGSKKNPGTLLLEIVPQIKQVYLERVRKRCKKLAREQLACLKMEDSKESRDLASRIADVYTSDALDATSTHYCAQCGAEAPQRCARCRSEWYCGRECQVRRWSHHKEHCDQLAQLLIQ